MRSLSWLALLFLSCGPALSATAVVSAPESWAPTGHSAQTITGSVTLSPGQVTFQNGPSFQLSKPTQMLYRPEKKAKKVTADLYRVTANPSSESGSKLCGARQVAYLIVWKSEKPGSEAEATIVAFSGPKFEPASPDECGRYVYDAGHR